MVIHSGDKTASKYEIKKIGDKEYLFLEWKSGDYTIPSQEAKVLRPENGTDKALSDQAGRIEDNIDLPFANDDAVLGRWTSVDFVDEPSQFNSERRHFGGDLYMKELKFLPGGKTSALCHEDGCRYFHRPYLDEGCGDSSRRQDRRKIRDQENRRQ